MEKMQKVREASLSIAKSLGYQANENLPLLDTYPTIVRSVQEIVDRMSAIYVVAAVAYGFERGKALDWLNQNGRMESLTPAERRFLKEGEAAPASFKYQIEGLWTLFWSCSLVDDCEFSFGQECPEDFILRLPDLKSGERGSEKFHSSRLRRLEEVVAMADLAYCIHWSVRNANLEGNRSTQLPDYVIVERRRALEWLLDRRDWESISLDT